MKFLTASVPEQSGFHVAVLVAAATRAAVSFHTRRPKKNCPTVDKALVLRSKTPDWVRQKFYGFLLTYFAIRGLMDEAACSAQEDPDRSRWFRMTPGR